MTETILENNRVCGIHFYSGKAAWVASLHLGHDKLMESDETKEKQRQRAQRITKRRKREREREEQEAKVGEAGERVKDIYKVDDVETSEETGEEEEEKEEEPNVENNASTQTNPEGYSRSCSTQTEECDYMFRTQKLWLPQ